MKTVSKSDVTEVVCAMRHRPQEYRVLVLKEIAAMGCANALG